MSPLLQSNLRALCHILFILLQQTCAQLTAPSPTCPGQEAVFTCTGDDATKRGITIFRLNKDVADECVVEHDRTAGTPTCGPSGVFTAALESVVNNNETYISTLTVTATVSLDGMRVRCLSGAVNEDSLLSVITTPQLPDAVRQNNNQITLNRTTVINWQPATVNFGSDNVTYTVTSNLDPVDFNTTTTTATVVLPAFNMDYSFCVDSINTCGATSGTPRCATPPVRIEAEAPVIGVFNVKLQCSSEQLNLIANWTLDHSRNGIILRPPVTSLNLMCNGVFHLLTSTAVEVTLTGADCANVLTATVTLTAANGFGNPQPVTNSVDSVYRTPVVPGDTLQISDGAVCIELNPNCVESPSYQGFTAELQFTLDNDVIITVVGSLVTCDNGVRGFKFNLAKLIELKLETFLIGTLTLVSNGTIIQSINSLNIRQEESDSREVLGAGVGGGVGGLVAVSALANLLLHVGLVLGWGYLCLLGWAGPCCCQEITRMRMHGGLAFCVLLFYLTPVTTVLLTCYLCHLCCCKHSGDKEGKQVDVEMEANLCYGPVAGPQAPAIEDRRPMAGEDTSQYETISH